MTVPTGRDSDKFMLRLPDGMRERIKVAAEGNNRSMNAEIVATLEKEYPAPTHPLGVFGEIYELMAFVESAESPEEMREFLKSANQQLEASEFSGWVRLDLTEDPSMPGQLAVYMRSLTKLSPELSQTYLEGRRKVSKINEADE